MTKYSGMARVNEESHSFTCRPHVHPQMEWVMLAFTPQPQSITALWPVFIFCPTEGRRLSWPVSLFIVVRCIWMQLVHIGELLDCVCDCRWKVICEEHFMLLQWCGSDCLVDACLQTKFTQDMQPHYIYSPREMTRWVRGICEALRPLETLSIEGLVRIWAHEAQRLFQDRSATLYRCVCQTLSTLALALCIFFPFLLYEVNHGVCLFLNPGLMMSVAPCGSRGCK